jgi:hypothetical protein
MLFGSITDKGTPEVIPGRKAKVFKSLGSLRVLKVLGVNQIITDFQDFPDCLNFLDG